MDFGNLKKKCIKAVYIMSKEIPGNNTYFK